MMEYLEKRQLEEILSKRLRLKDKLADLQEDGVKLDLWLMESWTAGKKPLLLLARITYESLPGKAEYKLIMSQPGKNGAVITWQCPAVMPGAAQKNAGGRPVKYGQEAKEIAKALRAENFSIRKIADEMGASTFTVQRHLKS